MHRSQHKELVMLPALELCKAMRKAWQIASHNNENEDYDDNSNDSKPLETLLGSVTQK